MRERTYDQAQYPDVAFSGGSFRVVSVANPGGMLMVDGVQVDARPWLFPRCAGSCIIAKLNADNFHAWLFTNAGQPTDLGTEARGNWPVLVKPDGDVAIQRPPDFAVVDATGAVIRLNPDQSHDLAEWSVAGIPLHSSELTEPGMLDVMYAGNLVCGTAIGQGGAVLVRHRRTGNTLLLWPGLTPHYAPHIAWDGGTKYCITAGDYHTVWAMEFDESEVNVPPPPPILPPSGKVTAYCSAPGVIKADIVQDAKSGPVTGYRFLLDGSTVTGVDNTQPSATFPADAGLHVVNGKLIGPGGVMQTPQVFVTVAAPVVVQPQPPVVIPPLGPPSGFVDPAFHFGLQVNPNCGLDWAAEFKGLGMTAVRFSAKTGIPADKYQQFDPMATGLRPLWMTGLTGMQSLKRGDWCELFSGAGDAQVDPLLYAAKCRIALDIEAKLGLTVLYGCVDGTDDSHISWYLKWKAAMGSDWSRMKRLSIHHYGTPPDFKLGDGHSGRTLAGDFALFTNQMTADQVYYVTEFGVATKGTYTAKLWGWLWNVTKTWTLTDAYALSWLQYFVRWAKAQPKCRGVFCYQDVDGSASSTNAIDHYGIRTGDAPLYALKAQSGLYRGL